MNCDNASLLLYAVTDRSWLHGQTLYAQAEQALQGGATFLQLREKELDEAHFQEEAIALKALCKQYGVPFVLDDNVALAIETDADGVHVGQSDMAAGKVRELIGPDKILGVSAQTVDEALLAEREGADYAVDVYPYYGSDVEATLRAGYDIRHGLIGSGVYASHGYERSHMDGVLNTLKTIKGYLHV